MKKIQLQLSTTKGCCKRVRETEIEEIGLPLSLIESEILARLAVRSAGVCRCVCKQWKRFLSTPTFGRMHLQKYNGRSIDDYKLLMVDGAALHKLPLSVTIPPNPSPSDALVLASLDGLVCLTSSSLLGGLVFLNPLTGAYHKLSTSIQDPHHDDDDDDADADDDDDLRLHYGYSDVIAFYKDSSSYDYDDYNGYKLLYLLHGGDRGAYVYSHTSDTWRRIPFSFTTTTATATDFFCTWSPATSWGNCLYFTVTARYTTSGEKYSWIICFDVRTEAFTKAGFPPVPDGTDTGFCGSFVVLNGSLYLCVSYSIDGFSHGDLWRMTDADRWVMVAARTLPTYGMQKICTATDGNWLAVLDHDDNSFQKMNTGDFTARYPCFTPTPWDYRHS